MNNESLPERKKIGSPVGFLIILLTLLIPWSVSNLSGQQPLQVRGTASQLNDVEVSSTIYYVYENGDFKEAVLSKNPELIGGKELMETLIKLNIRYPEVAKEKKMGGTVRISVVIDTMGRIEDAFIHEGIGGGCNDEALRAVRLMDKVGFEPGEINGKPVVVKFDIPIIFLPQ